MDSKQNTGDGNTGDWNTGYRNTGDRNTGDRNTGYRNTGYRNTGDWNTGSMNTGYLNTTQPKEYLLFNKKCSVDRDTLNFPLFFYFEQVEFIAEKDMTEQEKGNNPTYATIGGYLRKKGYKEAWRESWDKADDKDRKKCLELPNWDNEVFKEISGIDVEKELNSREVVLTIDEIAKKFGVEVDNLKIKKD